MNPADFRRYGGFLIFCLTALLCSMTPVASQPEDPFDTEFASKTSEQRFERVTLGGTIRVVNPYGSVYSRFGGYEEKSEILIIRQRLEEETPELEVDFSRAGADLNVTVRPPAAAKVDGRLDTRDRIDLVIFVPRDVELDAQTHDGLIAVKKLKSNATASSLKGNIDIRGVKGRVRAKSARGQLLISLATGVTEESQDFVTETGDIEVWVGEDANANVKLATSGEISTDFSLEIEHKAFEEPGKHATATIGKGGPVLTLESKRGRVKILRLQKHFRPEN